MSHSQIALSLLTCYGGSRVVSKCSNESEGKVRRILKYASALLCMNHGVLPGGKEEGKMNGRIVILEDDEDIRELFSIVLQEQGFEVHLHDQVFADLAEVERLAPDLIIVDVMIGGAQEGWEFLHQLKAYPSTLRIPLILCTATKLTPEQESMTQSLGIPILYKPFELTELDHLICRVIGSSPLLLSDQTS